MNLKIIESLYRKYQTPKHVQEHMRVVSEVTFFLCEKLKSQGIRINSRFAGHLGLLHDLLKPLVFNEKRKDDPKIWSMLRMKYPKLHDAEVASNILEKINEQKLAQSILTQQFDAVISKTHPLITLEEKVVYYADKRVAHDEIVSLKERFREGSTRYPEKNGEEKKTALIQKKIYELEKQLCTQAHIKPQDVQKHFEKIVSS